LPDAAVVLGLGLNAAFLVEVLSVGEEDLTEAVTDDGNEVSFVLLASLSPAVAVAAFKPRPKLSFRPFQAMMQNNMCAASVFGSD